MVLFNLSAIRLQVTVHPPRLRNSGFRRGDRRVAPTTPGGGERLRTAHIFVAAINAGGPCGRSQDSCCLLTGYVIVRRPYI